MLVKLTKGRSDSSSLRRLLPTSFKHGKNLRHRQTSHQLWSKLQRRKCFPRDAATSGSGTKRACRGSSSTGERCSLWAEEL